MLKIKKQLYNSVVISADTQEELANSFMRFQEHYESPYWADKIFTIGQFKRWYSENYGADTYRFDWRGFNFPSCVLIPFKEGLFDPLTDQEKNILDLLKYRTDRFYVIGSNTDDVLSHELCHALYYSNDTYRTEVNKILNKHKKEIKKAFDFLLNLGYHEKVLYDEFQAYILDGDFFKNHNVDVSPLIKSKIVQLYKKMTKS
jgi:hypothetical protein